MKKIIFFSSFFLLATLGLLATDHPYEGGPTECGEVGKDQVPNGYCTKLYDENGGHTSSCLDPGASAVTKDCMR